MQNIVLPSFTLCILELNFTRVMSSLSLSADTEACNRSLDCSDKHTNTSHSPLFFSYSYELFIKQRKRKKKFPSVILDNVSPTCFSLVSPDSLRHTPTTTRIKVCVWMFLVHKKCNRVWVICFCMCSLRSCYVFRSENPVGGERVNLFAFLLRNTVGDVHAWRVHNQNEQLKCIQTKL